MPDADSGPATDIHPSHRILDHLALAGQWERLLQMARQRLEQQVDDGQAHRAAALALIRLSRPDEAQIHVEVLLRQMPDFYFHHQLAAQVAILKMDMRKAKRHLETALYAEPEAGSLHRLMALVLATLGDHLKAAEHTNVAQEIDGDVKESWFTREAVLAGTQARGSSWEERIHALQKALAHDPKHPVLLWRAGRLLLELERPQAAVHMLARAVVLDPGRKIVRNEWREACQRTNLIYRCLSFPWRSVRWLMALPVVFRVRPGMAFGLLLLLPFWLIIAGWWLLSWILLAPVGVVVRYCLFMHPAFDLVGLPRQWLLERSLPVRITVMSGIFAGAGALVYVLMPLLYLQLWAIFSTIQMTLQLVGTYSHVQERRRNRPIPPAAWLPDEKAGSHGL